MLIRDLIRITALLPAILERATISDAPWKVEIGEWTRSILNRVWGNFLGRSAGPMSFRMIIQPTVATIIAIRAGLNDAREGRPASLWAALSNPGYRPELLRQGWKDVARCSSSQWF